MAAGTMGIGPDGRRMADTALRQVTHRAVCRSQAKSAAAGQARSR